MSLRLGGLADPELEFQFVRSLAVMATGGAALGEVLALRPAIDAGGVPAWVESFAALGERVAARGRAALAQGRRATARGDLLRASMYLRAAEYYANPFAPRHRALGLASRDAFRAALPLLDHRAEVVGIPCGGIDLPGYLLRPRDAAGPGRTLVLVGGFDSSGEELYFQAAAEGLARGWTVLIVEGPGQTGCLRDHPAVGFRPDFEVPIGAALDHALTRPEVDGERIALYGISFGGYFAARAAARDRRIRALVLNSPIPDLFAYFAGFLPPALVAEPEEIGPEDCDAIPDEALPPAAKQGIRTVCFRFAVPHVKAFIERLRAFRLEPGDLGAIRCPSLILVGEGEGPEPRRQFEAFRAGAGGPVTPVVFDVASGAEGHCQIGNLPLSAAVVYDWLDTALAG
ncbi:alpha/beta hydrolase family protein [Azospirillum sp. ST 5-10]|uniref:alpha/beta hydrolase n=1 Tax=unclassified Azospirillum TaxID=2630922 RepID=UPI003F4A6E6B